MDHLENRYELLQKWHVRTDEVEKAHFRCSVKFRCRHLLWGIGLIVLSSCLGILTNIADNANYDGVLISKKGISEAKLHLSIIVPVLSALVTFLKYDERPSKHHDAAARFSALKRSLQLEIISFNKGRDDEKFVERLKIIKDEWDKLTLDCPAIYRKEWNAIAERDRGVEKQMAFS